MTKHDEPRDLTVYVDYDARVMWRDPDGHTGQIGPTFHSHDATELVTDRLYHFRDGLAAEGFTPSEVSSRSFVVAVSGDDEKRVKAGKVAITQDGMEARGTTVPEPDDSRPRARKQSTPAGASKDQQAARDAEKGNVRKSEDGPPPQLADQVAARDSKKDGPDRGDARRDVEAQNRATADEKLRRLTADR